MREILFRGKRVDNGEWVYGYYVELKYDGGKLGKCGFIYPCTEADYISVAVDPKTIGQYTGLNDKRGKKIFEGDIVDRWYHNFETFKGKREVKMSKVDDSDGWNAQHTLGWCAGDSSLLDVSSDCEIIGNIHDNPELLEV